MKIFQFNFLGILIFLAFLALVILLPSYIVQNIWNSIYSVDIERDMSIEIWQAALLWGAILTAIYMTGIFKFKVDFKTLDSIDLSKIDDPELKAEIEKLRSQSQEEEKKEDKQD